MLENYLQVQPTPVSILKKEIENKNFSHAYLFESNGYNHSFEIAFAFAKALLCPKEFTSDENCNDCDQCQKINDGNFLELKIIEASGMWIKKEQLIELQQQFNTKSVIGKRKIYIIKDADKLNNIAANSLLKFLEEPEENIIAILVAPSRFQLLETIVSRCQIISFHQHQITGSTVEKIANYLYNRADDIAKFIDEPKNLEKIEKIISFVQFYEKNKQDTLLYTNKLWTSVFKTKEDFTLAFEILLLYYRDLLNFKLNRDLEIFNDYNTSFHTFDKNLTTSDICHRISKIIEIKEYLKINANVNLILDKLVIELERS